MTYQVFIKKSNKGISLFLHIQPNAKKSKILGLFGNRLKIALQAPATENKANLALIEFLANFLGLAKRQIELKSGEKSREKTVVIQGLSLNELSSRLNRATPNPNGLKV